MIPGRGVREVAEVSFDATARVGATGPILVK